MWRVASSSNSSELTSALWSFLHFHHTGQRRDTWAHDQLGYANTRGEHCGVARLVCKQNLSGAEVHFCTSISECRPFTISPKYIHCLLELRTLWLALDMQFTLPGCHLTFFWIVDPQRTQLLLTPFWNACELLYVSEADNAQKEEAGRVDEI